MSGTGWGLPGGGGGGDNEYLTWKRTRTGHWLNQHQMES